MRPSCAGGVTGPVPCGPDLPAAPSTDGLSAPRRATWSLFRQGPARSPAVPPAQASSPPLVIENAWFSVQVAGFRHRLARAIRPPLLPDGGGNARHGYLPRISFERIRPGLGRAAGIGIFPADQGAIEDRALGVGSPHLLLLFDCCRLCLSRLRLKAVVRGARQPAAARIANARSAAAVAGCNEHAAIGKPRADGQRVQRHPLRNAPNREKLRPQRGEPPS
jgi:hypothetical protein